MNGYNFTERVRKVLAMAREEAARLHHEYVGTEHILLGLIREGEGVAATVLQNLNVELDDIQQKIEETVKKGKAGQTTGPDLPYTSRAKKVLEFAMTEARELNHSYVGTEHILLGLLREAKGIAAQVLNDAGMDIEAARAETLRLLGTESPRQPDVMRPMSERRLWAKTAAAFEQAPVEMPRQRSLRTLPPADWATDRARSVIGRARAEAAQRHSRHIEPEHLLLALLQEDGGMAATIMSHLGTDITALTHAAAGAIEETLATDEPFSLDLGYSETAELALRHAFHEARLARDRRVGTDHLLLGLLVESTAPASRVLVDADLSADAVRAERQRIAG
jgi:ATP-dependent Clp protease ATP-binding subunit ClpA